MKRSLRFGALCGVLAGFAQGALLHQYDFSGTLSDNFGGPSLTSNGGVLGAGSYSFDYAQGLSLLNPGIGSVYTIDMTITLDAVCVPKFCKLLDFQNLAADAGLYTTPGANQLQLWPFETGPDAVGTGAANITIQRNAAGTVTVFLNGVQQFTSDDSANQNFVFNALNNIIWFLHDEGQQGVPGEHARGSVDWIRIYDTAETPAPYVEGQGANVPEPSALGLGLAGLAAIGLLRRTRR